MRVSSMSRMQELAVRADACKDYNLVTLIVVRDCIQNIK
jgi:hypothetical protein